MAFEGPCQIRRAIMMGNGVAQLDLKADDGSFDWSWFVSSNTNAREVLAAALTAIATNKSAYATIGDPVAPFAQLLNFGVVK